MSLNMITDRTQADVDALIALIEKGENMTAAELEEYVATPHKGGYTYVDYNRVGAAAALLAGYLTEQGYGLSVTARSDYPEGYEPNAAELAAFIADVFAIRDALGGTETLPAAWDNPTYQDANNIESSLLATEARISSMNAAYQYCGAAVCGGDYL